MYRPSASLFLVGPMGAGKSTIGRLLAQSLSRPFVDSDKEIETRTGASIPHGNRTTGNRGIPSDSEKP